jgi:imidazolonepropionase
MTNQSSLASSDVIWRNARILIMKNSQSIILDDQDLVVRGTQILGIFPRLNTTGLSQVIDVKGALITAGLIDCHTHLVFAGNRAQEWEMRLNGANYADIASQGGGINHTVNATRAASEQTLYSLSQNRLHSFLQEGVTTIELKSGYGLNLEAERKQLLIAKRLAQSLPVDIVPTLLAAHTIPPEYKGQTDAYIEYVCSTIIPTLWSENLFESIDVFCETVGFNIKQTEKVFQCAAKLKIPVRGHTEQLSNLGGSALVARYHGLSVDHIEYLDEIGVQALQTSETVATLLPLAFYFLKEKQIPPIELLRKYKIPIAVASDFNPGTAPFSSLRWAMNMASVQFGLTPDEVLSGVTIHAAKALQRSDHQGQIQAGFDANFCVWDVDHPVEIFYELGCNPLRQRVFLGKETQLSSL